MSFRKEHVFLCPQEPLCFPGESGGSSSAVAGQWTVRWLASPLVDTRDPFNLYYGASGFLRATKDLAKILETALNFAN